MRFISKKAAAEATSYHPVSIMRLVRAGKFPKPVAIGPGRIAFIDEEVDAWIDERVAERDAAANTD